MFLLGTKSQHLVRTGTVFSFRHRPLPPVGVTVMWSAQGPSVYCHGGVCIHSFLVFLLPRGRACSGTPVTCVGIFLCVFWDLSLLLLWILLWSVVHWIHKINPLDFFRMQSMSLFMSRKLFLWIIAVLVSEVPSEPRGLTQ